MIDPRSTRAYKLEKENRELKKEIKDLIELCNKYEEEHNTAFKLWTMKMEEMPNYEESKLITDKQWKEYQELKEKNKKAIRRISIVRMDKDTTIETHKALDFVLQALIGADKE